MNSILSGLSLKLKNWFQPKRQSLDEHNTSLYSKHGPTSSFWADFATKQLDILETAEFPLGEVLKWQTQFETVFDIGSGPGWLSDHLSSFGKRVFAIEPSLLANEVAIENIKASNVTAIRGFAEDFLKEYTIRNEEALFVSQSVFQHLSDRAAKRILKEINSFSTGYLCFAEPYSEKYETNYGTTNIRKADFYQRHLSNWDLYFEGIDVSEYFQGNRVFKGFYGRTKSKDAIR